MHNSQCAFAVILTHDKCSFTQVVQKCKLKPLFQPQVNEIIKYKCVQFVA